jgi:hypothetical protein
MSSAIIGEEFVAFFEGLVDKHDAGKFDGALASERFVVLYRLGASEYGYR